MSLELDVPLTFFQVAEYVTHARDVVLANDPTFKSTGQINADHGADERLSLIHRLLRQSFKAKQEDKLSDADIISPAMGHTCVPVTQDVVQKRRLKGNLT